MKKLNYELIVSDFDGTLIDDNQCISTDVKDAISEYVSNGGIFAVCTGRMLASILPQVRALGLKGLVIGMQGTVIADIDSGRMLKHGAMSYLEVYEICKTILELNQPVNIYADDKIYSTIPKDNIYLQKYERIIGVESEYVENIAEFVLKNKINCQKVAVLIAESEQEAFYNTLSEKLSGRFDVTCSATVLVEVSPITDNKGEGIKFLANYFNIPIEKTIAMGDNLNDLPMVKAAGLGVAVGNAAESLKRAADYITVSNNDGAVGVIIKKFGYA